jgi:mono/diheme cytochrome c family protein
LPNGAKATPFKLTNDPVQLVTALDHANGWIRDKAQQMLVDGQYQQAIPLLRQRLSDAGKPLGRIHALWTLEGLHALTIADVKALVALPDAVIRTQALAVLPSILNAGNKAAAIELLNGLVTDPQQAPAVAFVLPALKDAAAAKRLMQALYQAFPKDGYVADAVISNVKDHEAVLLEEVKAWNADTNLVIRRHLQKVLSDVGNRRKASQGDALAKEFPRGNLIFKTVCQTCHGADGEGIRSLAPPLNHSDLVTGKKERLIAIVLYGLTGPVTVNGKTYAPPEINGDMPGIGSNDEFSDGDIAQLMSFIRNSWGNKADKVTEKDILTVREKNKGRQKSFTMEDLK